MNYSLFWDDLAEAAKRDIMFMCDIDTLVMDYPEFSKAEKEFSAERKYDVYPLAVLNIEEAGFEAKDREYAEELE